MNQISTFFFILLLFSLNTFGQAPPENPASGAGTVTPVLPSSEAVSSWVLNGTIKYGLFESLAGKIGFYTQADFSPTCV
ncbi:MAG: hypothetical protein ACKVQV_13270 [Bacteroidia bacterium]